MFSKLSATIVALVVSLLVVAVMLYFFHTRSPMIYRMELEHKSSIGAGKESAHSITVEEFLEGSNAVRFVPIVTFSHLHPEDWKDIMGDVTVSGVMYVKSGRHYCVSLREEGALHRVMFYLKPSGRIIYAKGWSSKFEDLGIDFKFIKIQGPQIQTVK